MRTVPLDCDTIQAARDLGIALGDDVVEDADVDAITTPGDSLAEG